MGLKKGFLVVFEGIDGAGKTTQAKMLYDYFVSRGIETILSKEPTDSIYGQKIKKFAISGRDSLDPNEEYRLFLCDRKVHVQNLIIPSLEQKKVVILDRYYFSTIAYQGAIGLDPNNIKNQNEAFSPIPEIVFLLEIPPRIGLRRIQSSRNEVPNLFEKEDNLKEVAKVFSTIQENYIVPINGAKPIEAVHATIINVIRPVIDHYLEKYEQYELFNQCYR